MPPTRKSSKIIVGCSAVIVTTLVVGVCGAVAMRNLGGQEQASRANWQAAQRRWERNEPANYDITVEVQGRRAAVYRVEVRQGVAQSATLDGQPIDQRRLFSVWSVPGMFATLDREFDLKRSEGSAKPGAPQEMRMYCQWHELYGYPISYRRLAVGGDDISWQVTEFTTLPETLDQ
jgi:hypothetical protein